MTEYEALLAERFGTVMVEEPWRPVSPVPTDASSAVARRRVDLLAALAPRRPS